MQSRGRTISKIVNIAKLIRLRFLIGEVDTKNIIHGI